MSPPADKPSHLPECRMHVARHPSRTVVTDGIEPDRLQGQLTHWLLGAVVTDEQGLYKARPVPVPTAVEPTPAPSRTIGVFVMFFVGVWTNWFVGVLLGLVAFAFLGYVVERVRERPGRHMPAPPPVEPRRITLFRQPEREAYEEALECARRFSEGWPALVPLIDPHEARDTMARTLWEVAEVLAQRQAVYEFLTELTAYDVTGLPADSPVLERLEVEQRNALDGLPAINAEVHWHLSNLRAMADSTEEFAREMELRERERAIDDAIDSARRKLDTTAAGRVAPATASRELADRTAAVLAAYREITSRYAPG